MKCPKCDKPLEGRQKYCSATCRKKASRQTAQSKETPDKPVAKEIKGHWFGKAPHRPTWTTCARENCTHAENQTFDWEVTCTAPCCLTA